MTKLPVFLTVSSSASKPALADVPDGGEVHQVTTIGGDQIEDCLRGFGKHSWQEREALVQPVENQVGESPAAEVWLAPGSMTSAGPNPAALQEPSSRLALAEESASVQDNWSQKPKGKPTVTASLDGEIRDGNHHLQVRIYFEDTDAGQIVYHANFLRFMERGRTNYLRLLGTNQQALLEATGNDAPGFSFVVRSMTIDFLKPAVLDDLLDVITIPQEVRGASIALLQECRRGDDLLVTARARVAFISGGKARRIPKSLRLAVEGHR